MGKPKTRDDIKDDGAKATESLKRFEAQERKCQRLEREVNECKEELKQAKASYDFAVGELRRMVREPDADEAPLFGKPDAWREIEISALGLSEKLTGLLVEKVDGNTMGHLADWLKADHAVIQITGFGPAAIEKFDNAMERFWRDHPQPDDEPAEPESGD